MGKASLSREANRKLQNLLPFLKIAAKRGYPLHFTLTSLVCYQGMF